MGEYSVARGLREQPLNTPKLDVRPKIAQVEGRLTAGSGIQIENTQPFPVPQQLPVVQVAMQDGSWIGGGA